MSDVMLSDAAPLLHMEQFYTAQKVRGITHTQLASQCNWLNFYARRVLPYHRYDLTNTTSTNFIYPVGGENYSNRELTVVIGVRDDDSGENPAEYVRVSSSTMGGISSTYNQRAISESGSLNNYVTRGPGDDDVSVEYFFVPASITGDTVELIEILVNGSSAIDGVGAWELPPGDGGSTVGGVPLSTSKISSTINNAIDFSRFYPGANIRSVEIVEFTNASHEGCLNHGRIFFSCGRPHTGSPMNLNATSAADLPAGGIYFPPCQGVKGRNYVTVHGAVWGSGTSTPTVALKSESLSYTGSTISLTGSNLWQPFGSNSASSGFGAKTTFTGRADPDGDWLYLNTSGTVNIYACTLWVEES